ncbi:L-rhamnose mutarotase [Vibrio artabrorum]|uniref:L-rhamnose mutarotase n=1 Tax=Vibrio artabrorum TaxID=446374 RepID=A0ABT8CET4_9VIBR|nr:L-rhamnose mutarotase [Vibrio artabrorum]MDN3700238.1 L-rhamnose mutarotase [Vibrio artabrorum]
MWVNKDSHKEYQKRHDEIWGRLVDVLKSHGCTTIQFIFYQHRTCYLLMQK